MNRYFFKKTYSVMVSVVTLFIIMLLGLLMIYLGSKLSKIDTLGADGDYTLTVTKISTITVYVTGQGVDYDEEASNNNVDIYNIEPNSTVTLRAVNESRIFTNWEFTNTVSYLNGGANTDSKVSFNMTGDNTVVAERRDSTTEDYGSYMLARYLIEEPSHLLALQNILNGSATYEDFNVFFDNDAYSAYKVLDDSGKANYLNQTISAEDTRTYRQLYTEKIQNGYFLITGGLTVFDPKFEGLEGFKGVMCGLNDNTVSKVFINISKNEETGTHYYGLFQTLEEEAVIRNLYVSSSIGIKNSGNASTTIYAGALAGTMNDTLLYNVTVSPVIGIDSSGATIYAGGIAGKMTNVGIDEHCNVNVEASNTWMIQSPTTGSIYAGLISGHGTNCYINEVDIDTTGGSIELINNSTSNNYSATRNSYLGGLFGYYTNTKEMNIKNIYIHSDSGQALKSKVNIGNSYVGGLFGYATGTSGSIELGLVEFVNRAGTSKFISQNKDASSRSNVYSGGLFAYINYSGISVVANNEFKHRIEKVQVGDKYINKYTYLFTGNYEIDSIQNGYVAYSATGDTYGRSISGGLVGRGYININGTDSNYSNILLSDPNGTLEVNATQGALSRHVSYVSATSTEVDNDMAHCSVGLLFGCFNETASFSNTINYINVYVNTGKAIATREMGSRAVGDVQAAGFVGYSIDTNYSYINMYLNDCDIQSRSLSYEVQNTKANSNSCFAGSFIGEFNGSSSKATMTNVLISGWDFTNDLDCGTTSRIDSIQNTIPGGGDYKGENNCGGVIGRTYYASLDNVDYKGSTGSLDYIQMQGHQSPDSAFCGGIIGFVKQNINTTIDVKNCDVINAKVYGSCTIITKYKNPDIFIGGIIGACYTDGYGGTINVNNCTVYNSDIYGIGNERIEVYTAGVIGVVTWSGSGVITNCYVYNSNIFSASYSNSEYTTETVDGQQREYSNAFAGGIAANKVGSMTISYCAIMDSKVHATSDFKIPYAAGVMGSQSATYQYCYSNATITTDAEVKEQNNFAANTSCYGIAVSGSATNCFFVSENAHSKNSIGTALSFGEKLIEKKQTDIFTGISGRKTTSYYVIALPDGANNANFSTETYSNEVVVNPEKSNVNELAEIWVNVKQYGNSTFTPTFNMSASDIAIAHSNGWFMLGEVVLYSGTISGSTDISDDSFKLEYETENELFIYDSVNNKFNNQKYPYIPKDYIGYDETITAKYSSVKIDSNTISTYEAIQVKLYDGIPTLHMSFKTAANALVITPVIYTISGSGNNVAMTEIASLSSEGLGHNTFTRTNTASSTDYVLTMVFDDELAIDTNLYIVFKIGAGSNYLTSYGVEIQLIHNALELYGVKYVDYTKPLNYKDAGMALFGQDPLTYYVRTGSTTKFVPVFTKSNDPYDEHGNKILYDSELNVEKVTYTKNSGVGTVKANGEYLASTVNVNTNVTTAVTGAANITVTLKEDTSQSITFNTNALAAANYYSVSYSGIGGDIEGITYASGQSDYYFKNTVNENFSGEFKTFNITLGSTYDLVNYKVGGNESSNRKTDFFDKFIVYADGVLINPTSQELNDGDPSNDVYDFSRNAKVYEVYIKNVGSSITISFEMIQVYAIRFNLQSSVFNSGYLDEKVFYISAGDSFHDHFGENGTHKAELDSWVNGGKVFGYYFSGWYLNNDGDSINSYGSSLDDISKENSGYVITSSMTFYARWSFLIELVEAPGTHILSSFNENFMQIVNDSTLVNRTIAIPINANKGYVFTVKKDAGFVGEAAVEAYSVTKDSEGNDVITNIIVEKYYTNMYNYYIAPEYINGYLVIATSISNSDVIVGENETAIYEDILPEDGVMTFKYVVNHRNAPKLDADGNIVKNTNGQTVYDQSYIYSINDYQSIVRDIKIMFSDMYIVNGEYVHQNRNLPIGTTIEVFYHKYVNGNDADIRFANYIVEQDGISSIKLSDFLITSEIDQSGIEYDGYAFKSETFGEILGSNQSVSESFYFVVSPPNGYESTQRGKLDPNTITYEAVRLGYIDGSGNFLEGQRTQTDFANKEIEDLENDELLNLFSKESSIQVNQYLVTPSRQTTVVYDDVNDEFTFSDNKNYKTFDVTINPVNTQNTEVVDGDTVLGEYLLLNTKDKGQDYNLKIQNVLAGTYSTTFRLGYNKGTIKVYGVKQDDSLSDPYVINVDSIEYKDYFVYMNEDYKALYVENASTVVIGIDSLKYVCYDNRVEYSIDFNSDSKFDSTNNRYDAIDTVVGDIRHDGVSFIFAVQLVDNKGNIVEDIDFNNEIVLSDGTNTYSCIKSGSTGRNVLYYNLSNMITDTNNTITFTIENVPTGYTYKVLLLEADNVFKPAMAEVRLEHSDIVK